MNTIKWISNDQFDIFKDLLEIPDYLIETPLYFNDIYIKNYIKTPLYNGMYKNEVYGNVDNLTQYIDHIPIKKLIFNTTLNITIDDINGIINILSIALFKHFNFIITNLIHKYSDNIHYFVPKMNDNYIYDFITNLSKIHDTIHIDNFIGYTSLLNNTYNKLDYDIQCSDFIWMCNLKKYNYINILNIPLIKVEDNIIFKSNYVENGINDISIFSSKIRNFMKNSFLIDIIYKDIIQEFINVYNFTYVGESLNNHLCLQHDTLNKQWLLNSIYNIYNNKVPLVPIIDKSFGPESTLNIQISLKYNTMRALSDFDDVIINKHLNDVTVGANLIISLPWLDSNTYIIKTKIKLYMQQKIYIYKTKNYSEAVNTKNHSTEGNYYVLSLYDNWYVVGNMPTKIYPTSNIIVQPLSILPSLSLPGTINGNAVIVDDKIYTINNVNMNSKQLQYLWSSGKYLTDWGYYYYKHYNKISNIPLLNTNDILYHLEANV